MDLQSFTRRRIDSLSRSLTLSSRRGALGILAVSPLAGLLSLGVLPGGAKSGGGGKGKKKGKRKVQICHQGQTRKVSKRVLKRHKKHGDTMGPCPREPQPLTSQPLCPAGIVECAGQCCSPGQSCAGGTACVNGTKALGALCTEDLPGECSTGVCGCTVVGCVCRTADCAGPGGACMGNLSCCEGVCLAASSTCSV